MCRTRKYLCALCLRRFLGWLKGFIHDRNHSTENLVRGYGRVTVLRRAPTESRTLTRLRYKTKEFSHAASSFLVPVEDRLDRRTRSGQHEQNVRLSRRNHRRVISIKEDEKPLWKVLREEFGYRGVDYSAATAVKFTGATGVKLDGYGKFTLLHCCDCVTDGIS